MLQDPGGGGKRGATRHGHGCVMYARMHSYQQAPVRTLPCMVPCESSHTYFCAWLLTHPRACGPCACRAGARSFGAPGPAGSGHSGGSPGHAPVSKFQSRSPPVLALLGLGELRSSLVWGPWQRKEQNYQHAHEKLTRQKQVGRSFVCWGWGAARRGQAGVVQAAAGWELVSASAPQVIPACRTPSSPRSGAVSLGSSQTRGSRVPCPVPVCWGTSGHGDPIAGPRDFSLADRSETSISCGCICKSTTSSAAVAGATGRQGWGHPGEGSGNGADPAMEG